MLKKIIFCAVCLLFSFTLYSQTNTKTEGKVYKIGDRGPAGGWIFYDKGEYSDGWRYLEAAPEDQSEGIQWYNKKYLNIGTTSEEIGSGMDNTKKIIEIQGKGMYAASICFFYDGGGKKDWFLPSAYELEFIYTNLYLNNIGAFAADGYWSSTEDDAKNAVVIDFYTGHYFVVEKNWDNIFHNGYRRVRAIRAF
jgi:hypothetical protein